MTFSFNSGRKGANTTLFNYFYLLPMHPGFIGTKPTGTDLIPYVSGPAAGKAVYDSTVNPPMGVTWVLDANLANSSNFGVKGKTKIPLPQGGSLTVPLINSRGAMLLATANSWLGDMKVAKFAGTNNWVLPHLADRERSINRAASV